MKKVCTICNEEKLLEDFTFDKANKKDGRRASCKKCCNNRILKYIKDNPDKKIKSDRKSYNKLRDKKLAQKKEYYISKREDILLKRKEYAIENKEVISNRKKQYRLDNIDEIRGKNREYQRKNAKALSAKKKELINSTPLRQFKERVRQLVKNSFYRLKHNKPKLSSEILGSDWDTIQQYILSQFTSDMTWDAFVAGDIHIDHIKPLASAKTEDELVALCHYTNLQPLWALDNLKKGATFAGVDYKG